MGVPLHIFISVSSCHHFLHSPNLQLTGARLHDNYDNCHNFPTYSESIIFSTTAVMSHNVTGYPSSHHQAPSTIRAASLHSLLVGFSSKWVQSWCSFEWSYEDALGQGSFSCQQPSFFELLPYPYRRYLDFQCSLFTFYPRSVLSKSVGGATICSDTNLLLFDPCTSAGGDSIRWSESQWYQRFSHDLDRDRWRWDAVLESGLTILSLVFNRALSPPSYLHYQSPHHPFSFAPFIFRASS
jgi:hypothetical protein